MALEPWRCAVLRHNAVDAAEPSALYCRPLRRQVSKSMLIVCCLDCLLGAAFIFFLSFWSLSAGNWWSGAESEGRVILTRDSKFLRRRLLPPNYTYRVVNKGKQDQLKEV